jgi:hypothetical protein
MDVCGAEREGQRYGQAREQGENQRIEVQQGVGEVRDRGCSGVSGERERERKENDGEI